MNYLIIYLVGIVFYAAIIPVLIHKYRILPEIKDSGEGLCVMIVIGSWPLSTVFIAICALFKAYVNYVQSKYKDKE